MLCSRSALAGLLLAHVLSIGPQESRIVFAPDPGLTITQILEWSSSLTAEEFLLDFGGHEIEKFVGLEHSIHERLVVEEHFITAAQGHPLEFLRTYREVLRDVSAREPSGDESLRVKGLGRTRGAMEGHQVRFQWDQDSARFERSWGDQDPGGGLDEWLDGLEEDLEFRALFPADAVQEGDTWRVEPEAVRFLLAPGGELDPDRDSRSDEDDTEQGGLDIHVPSVEVGEYLTEVEGDFECQLLAFEGEGEAQRAVILFRVDVQVDDEVSEAMAADDPQGQVYDAVHRQLDLLGEGELRWDLEAHHLISLRFRADVRSTIQAEWTLRALGEEVPVQLNSVSTGEVRTSSELE